MTDLIAKAEALTTYDDHTRRLARRYPEVLAAHAEFGGELSEMLRLYDYERDLASRPSLLRAMAAKEGM